MKFVALAILALSGSALASDLTDAQANQQAVRMEKVVARAQRNLNQLIESGERNRYRTVVRDVIQFALDAWPEQKVIAPYFACKQAAVDLLQYGDAWARNDRDKTWRDHVIKNFRGDQKECKASVRNPDMSLKDIQ